MNQRTGTGNQNNEQTKKPSRKALIVNLIFFALLFGGVIIIPLSGLATLIALILIVFSASIIYTYLL